MRLLRRLGAQCASLAACGSFCSKRSKVLVVNMRAPVGWRMVLVDSWVAAFLVGAAGDSRETLAPESKSAVVVRSMGLVQPEWK